MKRIALLVPLLALLGAPVASAQQGDIFELFQFRELKFQFWPSGVENRQDSDGKGSAIIVHVGRVRVEDWDALELRHCIDGDADWCTYQIPGGNNDGNITARELEDFQTFAQIGLRSAVPTVDALMDTLQENLTVDGLKGKNVKIIKVVFENASGPVDRNDTIMVDIDAKVTYENEPKASKYLIRIGNLSLRPDFVYDNAIWVLGGSGYQFDASATNPVGAKARVNPQGYFSSQTQFEDLSVQGLEFTITKGSPGKRSPGLEPLALLGALAALVVVRRRE